MIDLMVKGFGRLHKVIDSNLIIDNVTKIIFKKLIILGIE